MPQTSGSGNPPYTKDETLLALDVLYTHGPVGSSSAHAHALSALLQQASSVPASKRRPSFRNTDGVALKLQNLLSAIDPSRGLSSSKTDREVVAEFPETRKEELQTVAALIRAAMQGEADASDPADEPEEAFKEGQILTVRHRRRDRRLRAGLLRRLRDQPLVCEICDYQPPSHVDRELQEAFFEAHHRIPLAAAEGERNTRVSDMALLCAGCHRFIHRLIVKRREWVSPADAKEALHCHAAQ